MSKGTQMRKFRTFKEAAQKIVIKKPWGVEVKSYKAGDPIPAGVEFKIFDANDTAKIEAYADGLDESADYQKERFLEPAYMYNESKKVVENKMVGIISLPVGSKFIDDSFGGKRTLEVVKHGNDDVVHVKEVGTERKFVYDASTPGGNKKVEKIEEGSSFINESSETYIIQDSDSNNKPIYFHYGKYTGYDWGFDKKMATKFSTKEAAERMIEKMRQEGMLINSMKVVSESLSSKTHKFKPEELKVGKRVIDKVGGHEVHGKITVNHHDLYKDNPYTQDKKGSTVVTITTDKGRSYDVDANDNGGEFILEGRIAKGYENLDADERAKHLLSHPSSKYMNDLKSENITERAIRKAVKEMLGKPDKRDPQFIIDVNEDCIKESSYYIKSPSGFYVMKTDNFYDLTDDKEKALKYTIGNDAAKELAYIHRYSPDSRLKKLMVVQEEGEAPAIANTTAEVANPELPLKLKESVGQKLNITLIRKPQNMKEVESGIRKGYGDRVKAIVDKSYKLSANEYDKFVYNFMVHTTYLSGEGGVDPDGTVHVVEISAPGKKTIYVDPEGYDHARYVGW